MIKIFIVLIITGFLIFHNTSYCQDSTTTIQDALDFISINLNHSSAASNASDRNNFDNLFYTDESYVMNYDFEGQIFYSVISVDGCVVSIMEKTKNKTKISFSEDSDNPEEIAASSVFENINTDTIVIDFSKISRIESNKTSITFHAFNNANLIEHKGTIVKTPPKKRKNDLLNFLKENEEKLYFKTRKYLKSNGMNYETYPSKTESYSFSNSKFVIQNIEREKCKRLLKAFSFLRDNCSTLEEKF